MRTMKLKNHSGCQCKIIAYDNGRIDFISYATRVITIQTDSRGNREIECTGTYSPTTARQITYFLREYAPELSLNDMKKIVGRGFTTL